MRPLSRFHLVERRADEVQVGDVAVGQHVGQADVVDELEHRVDAVDQGELERLQLDRDFQVEGSRVLA